MGWLNQVGEFTGLALGWGDFEMSWTLALIFLGLAGGLAAATLMAVRSHRQMVEYARNLEDLVEARTEELRESERHYRRLTENANDIIYTHDLKGRFTSLNRAGEELTGYTRREAMKLNISQVIAPKDLARAREMIECKLRGEQARTAYELEIVGKDGRTLTVEVSTRLILENGQPVAVQGIARDKTEQKQLQAQLRQSQKMEAMGRLAGGVAHDFNNLLMVIQGYVEMLLEHFQRGHPMRKCAQEIQASADRASALTDQLLVFSRRQMLDPQPVDLNSIVAGLESMLRRLIGEDIELAFDLDPSAGHVKGDRNQLEQVVLNLAINARDAMPQGGRLEIKTSSRRLGEREDPLELESGDYASLVVSDNGSGMDEKTLGRIFEPFYTTKGPDRGTGLGLSTVYGIIRQCGGSVEVESEPGRGSRFEVLLPAVAEARVERGGGEAARADEGEAGCERVLVVEDEEGVRNLIIDFLDGTGYQVLAAGNGSEALEIVRRSEQPIDLLVTDVVMPGMSGKQLAAHFRNEQPQGKILYMSGYSEEAIGQHGIRCEQAPLLQKPFRQAELLSLVRQLIDAPAPREQAS